MDALSSVRLIGSFRFVWIGSGLVHLLWPIPRLPLLLLSPSPTLEVYRINRRAIHFSVRVCVLIKHIELKTKTNVEDEMPETGHWPNERTNKQGNMFRDRPVSQARWWFGSINLRASRSLEKGQVHMLHLRLRLEASIIFFQSEKWCHRVFHIF